MREEGNMLGLFAETPLHPGAGSSTGFVDLPVQRERHTGFPIIQASGLKGAMREVAEKELKADEVNVLFGPENSDHAGALAITDARLLAFPVRSLSQVYVWVTCPAVISRLIRDMAMLPGMDAKDLDAKGSTGFKPAVGEAFSIKDSGLNDNLVLEELTFKLDSTKSTDVEKLMKAVTSFLPQKNDAHKAAREKMEKHLLVISDEDFKHLVNNATQISARIKLKDNKTSDNLWYEETIPPDSLFYTLLLASKPRGGNSGISGAEGILKKVEETVNGYLQVGGNETVGQGWCALQYYKNEVTQNA